jgi:hypothetical protein
MAISWKVRDSRTLDPLDASSRTFWFIRLRATSEKPGEPSTFRHQSRIVLSAGRQPLNIEKNIKIIDHTYNFFNLLKIFNAAVK